MDETTINLAACPLRYIFVGYVGETGARPRTFDFSDWAEEYGTGVLQMLLQRPGDTEPYPVYLDIDGTTATWTPNATDTEKTGEGKAQLVYTVDGVIVKNAIIHVLIAPSLGAAGDPPEPYEDWLERLTELAAETQQSALDAAESAEEAGTSAGAAAGSAGAAAQSALDAEAAKTGAEAAATAAGNSAALARGKAAEAAQAAQTAVENADYSETQRIAAESAAVLAADSVERSEAAADGANQAKTDAQSAASAAAASASAASGSAADAASAVTEVETKGAEQITAINQAGATQIAAVDAAGAAQVQAIEDKGEEVIDSIPSDYTALADDVSDLKSSVNDPRTGLAQKAGLLRDTAEGAIASFVPDASVENLLGLTVDIEPVQDTSGGDPSPTHICPISGWGSVEIDAAGVNLFDKAKTTHLYCDRTITLRENSDMLSVFVELVQGATYTFTQTSVGAFTRYAVCDSLEVMAPLYNPINGTAQTYITDPQFTFTANRKYLICTIYRASADVGKTFDDFADTCQLTVGSAAPNAYHPYAGTTHTIQLGQTVYGGTLDATNGTMTVDRAAVTLDGTEAWAKDSDSKSSDDIFCFRAYLQNDNIKKPDGTASTRSYIGKMFADTMPTLKNGYANQYPMANTVMGVTGYSGGGGNYLYIVTNKSVSNVQSVSELKSWLAENPTTVVYELATPITIDLDPVTISTISGQTNNVWADAGDVSVEYAADLKHYIDSKIAAAVAALS